MTNYIIPLCHMIWVPIWVWLSWNWGSHSNFFDEIRFHTHIYSMLLYNMVTSFSWMYTQYYSHYQVLIEMSHTIPVSLSLMEMPHIFYIWIIIYYFFSWMYTQYYSHYQLLIEMSHTIPLSLSLMEMSHIFYICIII